jgi:hypothetical protein
MIIIPTTLPMLKLLLVFYDGAYGGANQISSSNLSAKFEEQVGNRKMDVHQNQVFLHCTS